MADGHHDAAATPDAVDDSVGCNPNFANLIPPDFRNHLANVWMVRENVGRMKQFLAPLGGHLLSGIVADYA
jgi:hypothetical protein